MQTRMLVTKMSDAITNRISKAMCCSEPIAFDPPQILTATRVTGHVVVPENELSDLMANPLDLTWNAACIAHMETPGPPALKRRCSQSGNILLVDHLDGQKAYFLQRKIAKTTFGCIRVGFLCEQKEENDDDTGMEWEVIKSDGIYPFEMVAVKIEPKEKVLRTDENSDENDPTVELSALQMVAAIDPNEESCVVGTSCICADHVNVFVIFPFHGEGTLFQYVVESGRLEESVARHFFQQILKGLKTLESLGICHRSLSLVNMLLRGSTCHISDLRSSLRIQPGVSLLHPQCAYGVGHPRYLAPEIVKGEAFDPYAVDLWAAAIMLCGMLFGTEAPFVWASPEDRRFKEICIKGNLSSALSKWEVENPQKRAKAEPVSDEALDLIQKMLWADPKDRLSLEAVLEHPWVVSQADAPKMTTYAQKMR